ncbi:glycosyltransferase family 39 protein [Stieleria sp. TO1_6]|uniref:ArnT family glycosyltransferase n=1 Tax=Stieleria tagensis TaxID=2956795 RepID=UPI00209A7BED|nr:glycosyltransferase family 39 protein [Stieleria tagensis]MCO8124209.1 glycosyltransferase family 39 protein [Stieleria tagensis]
MGRKWGLILLVGLLVVKVAGVIARGPSPIVLDAAGYWELGGLVSGGDWFLTQKEIAYRTPGYPWLIGLLRSTVADPLFALVCVQGMLWIATIGLIAWMAVDLTGDRRAAYPVLGLALLMISSVTYVTTVLSETLFTFLLVLHLWSVARFTRAPTVIGGVLMGATLGLAILTRPIAMLIWIADLVYLVVSWFWVRDDRVKQLCVIRGTICLLIAATVTIASITPWLVRNQAMFGKMMLTEFVGRNLWIVTFQDGSGAGLAMPDSRAAEQLKDQVGQPAWSTLAAEEAWRDTWTVSHALTAAGMDDAAADRLMKQTAIDAIKAAPGVFAVKAGRRLINFWRTRATELPSQVADFPVTGDADKAALARDLYAGQSIWGVTVAPVDTAIRYRASNWLLGNTLLMLLTGLSTMLLIWRRPTRAAGLWLAAVMGYFAVITAVLEIPAYRYRMILEPIVLLVLVAALCVCCCSVFRRCHPNDEI